MPSNLLTESDNGCGAVAAVRPGARAGHARHLSAPHPPGTYPPRRATHDPLSPAGPPADRQTTISFTAMPYLRCDLIESSVEDHVGVENRVELDGWGVVCC